MDHILASVCISTYNKAACLDRVLRSIVEQKPPFNFETIVCNDGSVDGTGEICRRYGVIYRYLDQPGENNPARARNVAYRLARGDVVIAQSDDVVHGGRDTIEQLVAALRPRQFVIATVLNVDPRTGTRVNRPRVVYTGVGQEHPLFFLGALWRRDLYAVGGNDEDFTELGSEDNWFADCLIEGLNLIPVYSSEIVGYHQDHPRGSGHASPKMAALRDRKLVDARLAKIPFCSSGGPWEDS